MNIASSVEHGRKHYPDKSAILFEDREISYCALDEMASRAAGGLSRIGVSRGDRVALFLPNIPEFVIAYLGAMKIGAIAVSLNSGLKAEEVQAILNDSDPSVIVTTEALRKFIPLRSRPAHIVSAEGRAEADRPLDELMSGPEVFALDLEPGAPASILYTSGTTGMPKGATLSHGNVVFTMQAKKRCLGIGPEDRLLAFLPLYHCFGQNAILNACLHSGATLVLHRTFETERILDSVVRDRATIFCGVPTTFAVLYNASTLEQMASVRLFFSAAATLPVEIEAKWYEKFDSPIYQGYGLTETSPFASYNHSTHHRPGSIGTPIHGVEMRVVSPDDGSVLPAGEKGEIVVRGPNVMLGYWNRPHETSDVVRDGWFHTGDIGRLDEDGYFFIEDRLKDLVIVGGFNVYPAEVENVLYQHPAVSEAAVYGVPDAVMGELVHAAVVLKPGMSLQAHDLIAYCRDKLANSKVPVEVEFVDELPKTRTGKVLKRVLRHDHSRRTAIEQGSLPVVTDLEELQRRIMGCVTEKLDVDRSIVNINTPFADYGLTSVMAVELAKQVESWVGRPVVPTITWHFSTISALARHLLADRLGSETERSGEIAAARVSQLSEEEAEAMLLDELTQLRN